MRTTKVFDKSSQRLHVGELSTLVHELEMKDKLLQGKDLQIKDGEKNLKEKMQLLEESKERLMEREKMLQDKKREMEKMHRQLEEKNKQLEEREQIRGDDPDPPPIRRRRSKDEPPLMGGESPGPAPPVSPAVSELRLVLLGGSTAGKRAAGDTILGTHTLTHTSTETQHSESRQGEVAGRPVTVVDTPDWFCSGLSEKDMRQDVGLCVRLSAPGPHAFLLLIPVESSEGEERRMLEKMEDIFGEGCWGHTLILFTHAEGLRERSVEELLQTGSQELQQLVEKCGNRCHLLNVKDRPDDTKITQLLEKIEEMVSGNRERFYSTETYQEAERQLREIERRIEEKWMERKEKEMKSKHENELENSLKKMKGEIQEKEEKIMALQKRIAELEKELENEKNEEKRRDLERQLEEEKEKRGETEMENERLKDEFMTQKREMEERHREEMEEMRESYEREARAEAERNLMKIILPELQRNISISKQKMEAEFSRQMGQKNWQIKEKDRELKRIREVLRKVKSQSDIMNTFLPLAAWWKATDELMEKNRQLEENKKTMEEKNVEMEKMKLQLEEKNREMEKMKLQLEEKNREISEKNKNLEEDRKTLQEKDKQLKDKDVEMQERKRLVHERDKQIEERENKIKERDKRIEESENNSQEKTKQLEMKDKLLQGKDLQIKDGEKNLKEKMQLLEESKERLMEREKMLQDKKREMEKMHRQLEEKNKQLEEREQIRGDDPDPPPIRRRRSKDEPPLMGGESPGPAPPVSPAVSELRLVLLGGSTAGKRAAGDTILGTHTLTHTSTETQHSESRQGEVAGRPVTVVDTPDWFCSGLSEKDMRQDVGLCVRLSAPGPHAFLLLIPVESSEGEERRMLEKMEDIFGEGCWGHTLILFTHAEGLRERSVEELLQTGSQELQQLVEKCGNRCHLLNVKDRPDDTKITQLLEKIEEMVSGNRERFYSTETYQEAERQLREIERRIEEKWMERKEKEMKSKHENELENSLKKMKGEIQEKEEKIMALQKRIRTGLIQRLSTQDSRFQHY
ncbi:uncharacterized protein LOC143100969 [Alosa pseudoharengus]|uniref:uncharacterized protein LOC143100969 n=1 Tax=Alosa pseudoharengus TaxID=34774 RepID=UPI003F89BC67